MVHLQIQVPHPAGDQVAKVGVLETGAANAFLRDGDQLLLGNRGSETDAAGRVVEPGDVVLEPENLAVVGPGTFEDSIAIQESVIEHGDHRGGTVIPLPIDPDRRRHAFSLGFRVGDRGKVYSWREKRKRPSERRRGPLHPENLSTVQGVADPPGRLAIRCPTRFRISAGRGA